MMKSVLNQISVVYPMVRQPKYVYLSFGLLLTALISSLIACANPLNQVTSQRYGEQCLQAESEGRLAVAEEACRRALINVDWGKLGPKEEALRRFELGRIKAQLNKYTEAQELFETALNLQLQHDPENLAFITKLQFSLATTLAEQGRWAEGAEYLKAALPHISQLREGDRKVAGNILNLYADELYQTTQRNLAEQFRAAANNVP